MLCGVGKRGACLWVIVLAGPCQADLPLMIDDLLTPEESLRFELGVGYANQNRGYDNQDAFAVQLGIRYGVLANTELYGKLTGRGSQLRQPLPRPRNSGWRLQGRHLTLGVNHRFSPDSDTPALLGFLDVLAVENIRESGAPKLAYARTWRAGVSPIAASIRSSSRLRPYTAMPGVGASTARRSTPETWCPLPRASASPSTTRYRSRAASTSPTWVKARSRLASLRRKRG